MTKVFDPTRERADLLSEIGVEWQLSADLEEMRARKALTGYGHSFLVDAVRCLLVGLDDSGASLLEKCRSWLLAAIAYKEMPPHYDHGATEALRYYDLVLCNWLLENRNDVDNLGQCLESAEVFLKERGTKNDMLDFYMVTCLEAGQCSRGSSTYLTTRPGVEQKERSLPRSEGHAAYLICLHHDDMDCRKMVSSNFLKRQVPVWLRNGHYTIVARWMKLSVWYQAYPLCSPKDALLNCYGYLQKPN